jgi:hypothetical protein
MQKHLALGLAFAALTGFVLQKMASANPPSLPQGANLPPVCCFGPACQQTGLIKTVKCGGAQTTIVLDASASYDPEGAPLTFMWKACPNGTIEDPTAAITTLTIDTSSACAQVCGVRLVVSDGRKLGFCRLFVEVIEAEDICGAKPRQLGYVYTGESCSASNFVQDPAGVTCSGDPAFADPVRIRVSKANGPQRVYFDGIVSLGGQFVADGSGTPSGKVPPNTRIQIFDMSGMLLQETTFHTSCSQPLEVGDQFGASIITGFTP